MRKSRFPESSVLLSLRQGPLGPFLDSFAALLSHQGYCSLIGWYKVRLVADLSQWLKRSRITLIQLDEKQVAAFLANRWKRGGRRSGDRATMSRLLLHLRQLCVIPPPPEAVAAGRFKLDNSNVPTKPHVSEPMEADLMDHFDTIRILTSTLGFPLFEKIQKPQSQDLLVCKGKKADATGEYSENGLIVFAGSICNGEEAKSMQEYASAIRQQLRQDGILEVVDQDTLRFTKDHVFPSPSQAAMVVLARNANGWTEWKYPDGRTLDEVKRKGP